MHTVRLCLCVCVCFWRPKRSSTEQSLSNGMRTKVRLQVFFSPTEYWQFWRSTTRTDTHTKSFFILFTRQLKMAVIRCMDCRLNHTMNIKATVSGIVRRAGLAMNKMCITQKQNQRNISKSCRTILHTIVSVMSLSSIVWSWNAKLCCYCSGLWEFKMCAMGGMGDCAACSISKLMNCMLYFAMLMKLPLFIWFRKPVVSIWNAMIFPKSKYWITKYLWFRQPLAFHKMLNSLISSYTKMPRQLTQKRTW